MLGTYYLKINIFLCELLPLFYLFSSLECMCYDQLSFLLFSLVPFQCFCVKTKYPTLAAAVTSRIQNEATFCYAAPYTNWRHCTFCALQRAFVYFFAGATYSVSSMSYISLCLGAACIWSRADSHASAVIKYSSSISRNSNHQRIQTRSPLMGNTHPQDIAHCVLCVKRKIQYPQCSEVEFTCFIGNKIC